MNTEASRTTMKSKARPSQAENKQKSNSAPIDSELKGHTALIYFHGMGEQRRYEEVSRLIDALDQFSHAQQLPRPYKIKLKMEAARTDASRPIGYIQASYNGPQKDTRRQEIRFYEGYYANLAAGGVRPLEVLRWVRSLTAIPLRMVFAPWRGMEKVRHATLFSAWSQLLQNRPDLTEDDRAQLLDAYDKFERWDARRDFPGEKFADFKKFQANYLQKTKNIHDPARLRRVGWLADKWRWLFIKEQLQNGFYVLLSLLTLLLLLYAIVILVWQIMTGAWLTWTTPLLEGETLRAAVRYMSVALLIYVLYALLQSLAAFLRDFVGDVAFWTTYQETAERHKIRRTILDFSVELLQHVLLNPECERVVLVGHSLGTTIAHDTILELARRNWATNPSGGGRGEIPVEKIQHLVTMGSPIDKVHYFFESGTSPYHRYNRVTRELRGDMGRFPFSNGEQRHMHWINFWDQADLASGPLETPTSASYPGIRVDNCEVASHPMPNPAGAHSHYLDNPNVVGIIYQLLFNNQFNFVTRFKAEHAFSEADLVEPQGTRNKSTRWMQASIVLVIWIVLASSLFTRTQIPYLNNVFGISLLVFCALFLMVRFVNWVRFLTS